MNKFAYNIKLYCMFLAYIFSCMNSFFQSTDPLREVSIIIASVFTSGYYISNLFTIISCCRPLAIRLPGFRIG